MPCNVRPCRGRLRSQHTSAKTDLKASHTGSPGSGGHGGQAELHFPPPRTSEGSGQQIRERQERREEGGKSEAGATRAPGAAHAVPHRSSTLQPRPSPRWPIPRVTADSALGVSGWRGQLAPSLTKRAQPPLTKRLCSQPSKVPTCWLPKQRMPFHPWILVFF